MARTPRDAQLPLFTSPPSPPARGGPRAARVDPALGALAASLPAQVRLGTSSWSFPGWQGLVYDGPVSPGTLARHGLAAYARHPLLRCVGLDRTYYGPVEARYFQTLAAQVPDDFHFVVKADERCTLVRFGSHPRHGEARGTPNGLFLDSAYAADRIVVPFADGLGAGRGVIVFQFPPQDLRPAGGPERFVARLGAFLEALPRDVTYAVEIRNPDVLGPAYAAMLHAVGAVHCVTVHPSMPDPAAQVAVTEGSAATIGDARVRPFVCRWMLRRDATYEDAKARFAPFDRLLAEDPATRTTIAELVTRATLAGRPSYVTVNNKAEGSAPRSVAALAAALAARLPA